jgi:hypothetical protein
LRRCTEQSRSPRATTALAVAEDLHLDVAGLLDVLLQVDAGLLEVGPGQAVHGGIGLRELVLAPDQAHADAAAAGGALQHHRVADAVGFRRRVARVDQQARTGQQGHAVPLGQGAGGVLEAEGRIWSPVGPMKAMPAAAQASAKSGFSERKP